MERWPTDEELCDFVAKDVLVETRRLAFTTVDARRTNGHVQGIAPHFEDDGSVCLYASLSDFPPGWGACLIEGWGGQQGLEAIAIPQGHHPGGINVCDGILCVPVEHPGRYGRLYLYDLESPLYPQQVGYFCQATFRHAARQKTLDGNACRRPDWVTAPGSDAAKASAAGIARMGPDWNFRNLNPQDASGFLVAVVHEDRYLRFFPFEYEGAALMPSPVSGLGADIEHFAVDASELADCWPSGRTAVVDNISLVNTQEGLRLVVLSAENLLRFVNLQRRRGRVPLSRDVISVYDVSFDSNKVCLRQRARGEMKWKSNPELKRGLTEWCWPGFRWGASLTWNKFEQRFELYAVEFFGDEEHRRSLNPTPPAEDGEFDGEIQYLQYATNIPNDVVDNRVRSANAVKPSWFMWWLRSARDFVPTVGALLGHRWDGLALPPSEGAELVRPMSAKHSGWWAALSAVVACVLFFLAQSQDGVTSTVVLAIAGSVAGFLSVALTSVFTKRWIEEHQPHWAKPVGVGSIVVSVLGIAVSAVGFGLELPFVVAGSAALSLFASGLTYELLLRPTLDLLVRREEHPRQLMVLFTAVSVGAASIFTKLMGDTVNDSQWPSWMLINRSPGWLLIVGSCVLLSLAVVKYLAPVIVRQRGDIVWLNDRRPTQAGVVAFLGLAVSVILIVSGAVLDWYRAVVAGGWGLLVIASVWGAVEYLRPAFDRTLHSVLRVVAWLLFLATAAVLLGRAVDDWVVAVVAALLFTGIGVLFVWPGEAGAFLVALAFVASWVSIDTESRLEPTRLRPDGIEGVDGAGAAWIVALGDSFISGEGASAFYEGTNSAGTNECHRSPTAWPDRLADYYAEMLKERPVRVMSFACSGATIDQVLSVAQHPGATPEAGGSAQLDQLIAWLDGELGAGDSGGDLNEADTIDYVLVSAGGNDAGFSNVIAACVMPATECDEDVMSAFAQRATSVDASLDRLLTRLVEIFASNERQSSSTAPTIIVNPYPDPVGTSSGDRCGAGQLGSLLSSNELEPLRSFRVLLNNTIERVVDRHGNAEIDVLFNTEVRNVQGNLCGGRGGDLEERQNWVELQAPDGGFSSLNPKTWVTGSLHPNEAGHAAIAAAACRRIADEAAESTPPICPPRGKAVDPAASSGSQALAPDAAALCRDADVVTCTDVWVRDRLAVAALQIGGAGLLSIIGGALLASAVARVRRQSPVPSVTVPGRLKSSAIETG